MKIIGHRGAMGLAPENTIASLLKAVEHGVDEVECDVRVTKDSVPVLLHDARLMDASGTALTVAEQSFSELKAHKPDLASLEEALAAVTPTTALQIEVKRGERLTPIIAVIRAWLARGGALDRLALSSKDFSLLQELHGELPTIEKVVIEPWSGVRGSYHARKLGTKRLSMNQLWLWRGFISGMARGGYRLSAYPLNDPTKARRWAKAGLSGVITDFPDRFEK